MTKNNTVLALDVGGTNLRIALIEIVRNRPVIKKKEYLLTSKVQSLSKVIKTFSNDVDSACIGFAGPIVGHKAKLTNAKLTVDLNELKKNTKLKTICLMNDFHAAGYGINYLKKSDTIALNDGKPFNDVKSVLGPGTGLGRAYIINNKVFPSEPGFTTLGIEDISDYALFDYLKLKYGTAYYEDVLSGRGLIDIYDHLEIKSNLEVNMRIRKLIKEEPINKARLITKYSAKDKLCDMTLRIFTKFYARVVRDTVLNMITSEIYLIGGISKAISPYLKKYFMHEFIKHRKYSHLLKNVRVVIVKNEGMGLIGAGAVAGGLISQC